MKSDSASLWLKAFRGAIRDRNLASQLQAAADGVRLQPWTELMTEAVVRACAHLEWDCAARHQRGGPLPVPRVEYLGIDVLAFPRGSGWRTAVAAFELENSPRNDAAAYALWKVCMVRTGLGCLFCYRRRQNDIGRLIAQLQNGVLKPLKPESEIIVVIGTRAGADTFPDGYFRSFSRHREGGVLTAL